MELQKNNLNGEKQLTQLNYFILFSFLLFSIAAILKTGGRTIFLPGILILFFIRPIHLKQLDIKKVIHFIIPFAFFFLIYHLICFRFNYNIQSKGDSSFFAQVSAFINYTGVESFYFDYTNSKNNSPLPYHYGESWTTIILSNLTGLNEFKAQTYLTVPVLVSCGFSFLYVLFNQMFNKKILAFCFAFIITIGSSNLIWSEVNIPFINEAINVFTVREDLIPKLAFSFFCNCIIVYSIFYSKISIKKETILITCFATLGCISFFPVLAVFSFFYSRGKKIKELKLLLFPIFIVVYYVIFYSSGTGSSNMNPSSSIFDGCIGFLKYIKTIFNITVKTTLQILFLYLPFILPVVLAIGFKNLKQELIKYKIVLIIFILVLLAGLLCWALLWFSLGAVSLFADGSLYLFKVAYLTFIFYLLAKHCKPKKQFVFVIIFLVMCFNGITTFLDYQNKRTITPSQIFLYLNKELTLSNKKPFIYLRDYDCEGNWFKTNLLAYSSLGDFASVNPRHQGIYVNINANTIKDFQDCIRYRQDEIKVHSSPYYQYKLRVQTGQKTELEILNQFIKSNSIKYLIAEKDYLLPSEQGSLFSSVITRKIFYDSELKIYLFEISAIEKLVSKY